MHCPLIPHAETRKIVDAPLTPIFMMGQGTWLYLSSQSRQPIHWLCISTTESLLQYLTYKYKDRWQSYSEWVRERLALSFAYKASQYHISELPQPIAMQITNDARPKIVDALLTIISRMGQGACCSLFCLNSQPIPHWLMAATNRHEDYQWCKTKNCWPSVDAHFAMSLSTICYHLFWPNISLMVFWHHLNCLHVHSPSSIHRSLMIHINISVKIYFEVSANCR